MKESFDNEGVYVNGALSGARTGTSKFTAYVSPYMVVSQGGNYTKHVYMGSQRITSKVSNSGIFTASPVNTTEQQAKLAQQTTLIKERFDSLGVKYSGVQQTGGLVSASPANTADSYFYHPDHLGSSSLITNKDGYLVQHIQYVPFGEVFVEERNANWSTPYKFNGKEQDEETGLCYYGARYYDPRTSVWLSVDPLAEKYPNMSSYVYCANNPVKYVDPDGREGEAVVDSKNSTININQKFYYNKNNENFKSLAITQDRTVTRQGETETYKAETDIAAEKGFGSQSWSYTDDNGKKWTVNYSASFEGLDGDAAVDAAINKDPAANKLVYDPDYTENAGKWNQNNRTLTLGSNRRFLGNDRGSTLIHEMGHSWGLPHENEMSGSPIYGKDNKTGTGIMSYGANRSVKDYEVQHRISSILKTTNGQSGKVLVSGHQTIPNKIIK